MNTPKSGSLFVIVAPSGAGKSSLVAELLKQDTDIQLSVSYTTRKPRNGEVDGKDYHFVTVEAFLRLRDAGFFAEWAEVHGNFYGTPLKATLDLLDEGRDVLFDIDVQGARQLRASLQRGRYVFIMPPSRDELEHRLRARGTDDEETIARRLANAAKELREARRFDAWIVNDDLERAYDELRAAYIEETLSPECRSAFLDGLLQGWND